MYNQLFSSLNRTELNEVKILNVERHNLKNKFSSVHSKQGLKNKNISNK